MARSLPVQPLEFEALIGGVDDGAHVGGGRPARA
jgi:hypothetical protein